MANEQSQNGRGEYQIDEITYTKGHKIRTYRPLMKTTLTR